MRSARGLQQLGSVNSLCQLPNLPELYFTPPELSNRIVSLLKDDIFLITIPKNVTKPSFWDDNWTLTAKTTSAAVAIGCYYLKKSNRGWSIHGLTLSDKEIQEVISVDCASEHDDSQGKLEVCGGWDSDEHGLNGFTNSSMNCKSPIKKFGIC
jgi:hypothetical protein